MISLFRKRVISNTAEYISNLYFPNSLILPEQIAVDNGITFNYGYYDDYFDGLIEHKAGGFHIYMNLTKLKRQDSPRSRFTFGHELGHYFLDEHRIALKAGRTPSHPSVTDFSSKNPVELEADYFSCSLLMPETRFRTDCNHQRMSIELIQSLSKKYHTSLVATLLRYVNIGNHPIVVICSKDCEILWDWKSDDFEFKYLKKTHNRVPLTTVTGEYYKNKKRYNHPEKIFAEDWFEYINYERNTYTLNEQCFYYDNFNMVFTIIW
ncbi:ImmA/IrrE family metallo-endopeptidase [Larkinella punicea]|uniref:ImmA/IrrE family metallo-endopeptidase n=1 Tax=Larkinella punicea TaxID=2315727 RepID=UPI001402443F|nr:ImmA/IrrE family metallo-endopeptidase [Larkinella punicea]